MFQADCHEGAISTAPVNRHEKETPCLLLKSASLPCSPWDCYLPHSPPAAQTARPPPRRPRPPAPEPRPPRPKPPRTPGATGHPSAADPSPMAPTAHDTPSPRDTPEPATPGLVRPTANLPAETPAAPTTTTPTRETGGVCARHPSVARRSSTSCRPDMLPGRRVPPPTDHAP